MRPIRRWQWPYPQTWRQVFTVIIGLDLAFLAVVFLLDWLKQTLGRWP